ncbi:MAG: M15 family metallopeptidase [Rhodobacteraceae bacterium]|nr:M15 family metallopeptidase [Paracoccaceae bacterium]
MHNHHVQMIMAAADFYTGGIDGDIGPKSMAAMLEVETKYAEVYTFKPKTSTMKRRLVACAQACLEELNYQPGTVDGWEGSNTVEAMNAFLFREVNGKREVIDREPLPNAAVSGAGSGNIPHQNDVATVYGKPGQQIKSRLVTIDLPFKLRIDWNLRQRVSRMTVHRDCATSLKKALIEVHQHYGPARKEELGIDRYAGAYNHRKMRGGSKWSMHAYGCAIDFYAQPNGLRMACPQALFCGPEYKDFLDIMESNEWLPALRLWGKDAMHFQRARL